MFPSAWFHRITDEAEKKKDFQPAHWVAFGRSPVPAWLSSGDSGVLPRPKDGHVKSTGARACPLLRGCGGEWPCHGRASSPGGVLPGALSLAPGMGSIWKKAVWKKVVFLVFIRLS